MPNLATSGSFGNRKYDMERSGAEDNVSMLNDPGFSGVLPPAERSHSTRIHHALTTIWHRSKPAVWSDESNPKPPRNDRASDSSPGQPHRMVLEGCRSTSDVAGPRFQRSSRLVYKHEDRTAGDPNVYGSPSVCDSVHCISSFLTTNAPGLNVVG